MSANPRYVCAFRGARDRYQAAVALAEAGELETLITDAYATAPVRALQPLLPASIGRKLMDRHADGLPDDRVRCLWTTTVREQLRHRLGYSPRSTWLTLDQKFGEAAVEEARRTKAHLLMYSPYAWEAFTARYPHQPRRILFQYHPHPDLESRLLAEDATRFPEYGESFAGRIDEAVPPALLDRERDSWKHADAIICSSAFTRRSLVEAGCREEICHLVPYGVEPSAPAEVQPSRELRALFVGSGGRRKGLHHLLLAWQRAKLPVNSRLTLVCRVIDTAIRALAGRINGVTIVSSASDAKLDALYRESTLLVMPSLVEGFGHVYLEALARGCPVLGTGNTALPDLGAEADAIFTTPAGDVDSLGLQLERLSQRLPGDAGLRDRARATAAKYSWSAFRAGVRKAIH
jgi:glycosyltransferase involved in cell wall biosynthesis